MFSPNTRWIVSLSVFLLLAGTAAAQFCEPTVSILDVSEGAKDVAVEGDLLFVERKNLSTGAANLSIYTLAAPGAPADPRNLSSLDLPGTSFGGPTEVKVRGTLALVTVSARGFFIDVTDPSLPRIVGEFTCPAGTCQDAAIGDGVAVAFSTIFFPFQVFDISDPDNPVEVGPVSTSRRPLGATTDGHVAYVSSVPYQEDGQGPYFETLWSYDLTDPASPEMLDELPGLPANAAAGTGGFTASSPLAIDGGRLYATSGDKIHVVDITDPANLVLLGTATVSTPSLLHELDVVGNVAYAAAGDQLVVVDLDGIHPNPPILGSVAVSGRVENVAVHDGIAYGAAGDLGSDVPMIDVSACPSPPLITSQPLSVSAAAGGAPVVFEVGAAFADSYQWRFNGAPIADGPNYAGAATATLTVQPSAATEGTYDVLVTNPRGSVPSEPAVVAVTGSADLTGDGDVDLLDFGAFLLQFTGPQ